MMFKCHGDHTGNNTSVNGLDSGKDISIRFLAPTLSLTSLQTKVEMIIATTLHATLAI